VLKAVEASKFLWKRKHFEERSWKRNQTRKRLILYGTGSGIKKYSIKTIIVVLIFVFLISINYSDNATPLARTRNCATGIICRLLNNLSRK